MAKGENKMPNKKGGYKIVSLKGLDLTDDSLELAGLYDALLVSYDKPILLCDINIDGEIKKNAIVQVEKTADGIKINDVYGYDILVEADDDIVVTANPHELPSTGSASIGQILKLDSDKKPVWGNETKELPTLPSDETKTYTLKYVAGTLTWVEDNA